MGGSRSAEVDHDSVEIRQGRGEARGEDRGERGREGREGGERGEPARAARHTDPERKCLTRRGMSG